MENENKRIKCGKCSSEYIPEEYQVENSKVCCPVCGFGNFKESKTQNKQILLD